MVAHSERGELPASPSRSSAAAVAKRSRRRLLRVFTRISPPVSGSTSQSSPTFGSSCSRGSRISTASTSWRPASSSSGRRQSRGPRKSETTTTSERWRASAPARLSASPSDVAPTRSSERLGAERGQQADQAQASLPRRQRARLVVPERDHAEPVSAPRGHVAERDRDALGDVRLAPVGRPELHRGRGVEHEPGDEHALGEVLAHVRLAGAGGHVPVDAAGRRRPARRGGSARARSRRRARARGSRRRAGPRCGGRCRRRAPGAAPPGSGPGPGRSGVVSRRSGITSGGARVARWRGSGRSAEPGRPRSPGRGSSPGSPPRRAPGR